MNIRKRIANILRRIARRLDPTPVGLGQQVTVRIKADTSQFDAVIADAARRLRALDRRSRQ